MGDKTGIEWCDATWNPIKGCSRLSAGCRHCWAEGMASRFGGPGEHFHGLTKNGRWLGVTKFYEKTLDQPIRWKRPRMIAVCLMGDMFHPSVPDEWIDRVYDVMCEANQHIYMVLTKYPERMAAYFRTKVKPYVRKGFVEVFSGAEEIEAHRKKHLEAYIPEHIWAGASIENQKAADERIVHLLRAPVLTSYLSVEPMLGRIVLRMPEVGEIEKEPTSPLANPKEWDDYKYWAACDRGVKWVICGGESQAGARPMKVEWAQLLAKQCKDAHVPFFFKQGSKSNWPDFKNADTFPEDLQMRAFPEFPGSYKGQ